MISTRLFNNPIPSFLVAVAVLASGVMVTGCDSGGNGGGGGSETPQDFGTVSTDRTVSVGETVSGDLDPSEDARLLDLAGADDDDPVTDTDRQVIDIYEVSLGAEKDSSKEGSKDGENVTIRMQQVNDLDPKLYLYEKGGTFVAVDDDGGSGVNAKIDQGLSSGDYYIVASAAEGPEDGEGVGDYELVLGDGTNDDDDDDDGSGGGDEEGDTSSDFSNTSTEGTISVGETSSGALESSDAVLSDIADADTSPQDPATETSSEPIDIYELSLSSEQDVAISMSGASNMLDTELYLYEQGTSGSATFRISDDGGSENSAEIAQMLSSGDYYIVASATSSGATGDYEIEVGQSAATFANTSTEGTIGVGETKSAALESSDAVLSDIADADTSPQDPVTESNSAPIDIYELSLSSEQDVNVSLQERNSSGLDTRVFLYEQGSGGAATFLAEDNAGMNSGASIDQDALAAGDYYIVASSASGGTGDYQLSVSEPGLLFWTLEDDGVVNLGDIKTGSFVKSGPDSDIAISTIAGVSNADDITSDNSQVMDLYEQDLVNNGERGEDIAITLRRAQPAESFRPKLYAYDGQGNFLEDAVRGSGTGNNSARITGSFSVDSLYIVPSVTGGRQGAGDYELDLVSTDDFESVDTESISLGETLTGNMEVSDQRLRTLDPILDANSASNSPEVRVDAYEFTLQSEQEVRIAMSEENFDRDLELYDASTSRIARLGLNDDAIVETLSAGTYYIVGAAQEAPDETTGQGLGEYTLELTLTGFDRVEAEGEINVGNTKSGTLESSDVPLSAIGGVGDTDPPTSDTDQPMDVYTLTVSSNQSVEVSVPFNDVDPWVGLYTADQELDFDDALVSDVSVTGNLSPGTTYYVVVSAESGETGDYEVTVSSN